MLESTIEKKISDYAKKNGVLSYKFASPAVRGVPDRIFIGRRGVLFMELKQKGRKPSALQQYHINKINGVMNSNVLATYVDDVEHGVALIDTLI